MKDEESKSENGKSVFDLTRVIPLASVVKDKWSNAVGRLLTIEPIHAARIDQQGRLHISYDASFIGIRDIESLLDELGVVRESGFWWRMKSAWYSYVDENAQSNACSTGGACCSRPPSVYGGARAPEKTSQWHFHN